MKCPICGDTLTPSKKNPDYMLCHSCRKKFRIPEKHTTAPVKTAPVRTEPAVSDEDDDSAKGSPREAGAGDAQSIR